MYTMTEELAYMVYQIDEYLAHSEKVMKENASLKKQATKLNTDLMALKKTLVITKKRTPAVNPPKMVSPATANPAHSLGDIIRPS